MKQIIVLSGKGGTGKTSVVAALAHLASREAGATLADLDVDAANLELVATPNIIDEHDFIGGKVASIDLAPCTDCGICADVCRFNAVRVADGYYDVDPINCEGCAACCHMCPAQAISMQDEVSGRWFHSESRFGPLFHARLHAAQENSGKLVTRVRQEAEALAKNRGDDYLIMDGPPGIGCPVIAACSGADVALIVTEPSISGLHDLERVMATVQHFGIRPLVVINKYDISPCMAVQIDKSCSECDAKVIAHISYDTSFTVAATKGLAITELDKSQVSDQLRDTWASLKAALGPELAIADLTV